MPVDVGFSAPVQTGPGVHQPPTQWVPGLSRGVKRPGRGVDHPPPSSAVVEGRVELYICSLSGPSWPVIGWTSTIETRREGHKIPCRQIAVATKFCTGAPKTYRSLVWNLLHVTVSAPRIFRWPLELWKTCAPLHILVPILYMDKTGISKSLEHGTRTVEDKPIHKIKVIFDIDSYTITRFCTFNRTCSYYGTTSGKVKTRFPSVPNSRQVTSLSLDRFSVTDRQTIWNRRWSTGCPG